MTKIRKGSNAIT